MVASFVFNTKAEFLKSKRTAAFWLTVIGAAFVPVINFIGLIAQPGHYLRIFKGDPWLRFINNNWEAAAIFMMPMMLYW